MSVIIDGDAGGTAVTSSSIGSEFPAFKVILSADQSISASTYTKVEFDTEVFDTDSFFDSTTNHRFQPTIAGYYHFSGTLRMNTTTSGDVIAVVYKNGAADEGLLGWSAAADTTLTATSGSTTLYLNGTTDYVELYGWCNGGSPSFDGVSPMSCCFQGHLVRKA